MSTPQAYRSPSTSRRRHIGLISTYPPKLCGLATFAAALGSGLVRAGHRVDVVRIDDGDGLSSAGADVVATLVNGSASSIRNAAAVLSRGDAAIVQHEYGIYGGADGEEVVDLLAALEVPAIVTLHTVPLQPTTHQRYLLGAISELATRLVVMTGSARERLTSGYPVDPTKVVTIPHGASVPTADQVWSAGEGVGSRPQLLTWGLLGPGKGIEHVIDALALLRDVVPSPRYTVAGVTHPKVFARDGDVYRHALINRSRTIGVAGTVMFDDTYRDLRQLTGFVASAEAIILPYDSRDQVTSGVLVDAIAAGRPVISTAFPHAVELLASGAGIVVPQQDPAAMAEAIRAVVGDTTLAASMAAEARRLAPGLTWASVAARYAALAGELELAGEAMAI
jgi:glycosyltransferase involved in cell wall biosynthesis